MKTRMIGGREVGAVGLGCMSFAGFYGATDEAASHACLARALDLGVTHWDTAEAYGNGQSEEIIGRFLAQNGARDRVHLATKGGIYRTDKGRTFLNDEASLRGSLEGSLRRLGVEQVDLYYVHRRQQDIPIEEVTGLLTRFIEEGKIAGFGFSEIAPQSLRRAVAVHPVVAVQSEYSLWTRQPELGMVQACAETGTTLVAFSPVARGMLGEVRPDPASFRDGDFRNGSPRFTEPNFAANCAAIDGLRAWAKARGWSTAGVAQAWCLTRGDHVLPIPGTRTSAHLDELAEGGTIDLTPADLAEIERLLPLGFAHGARYTEPQFVGIEQYC